MKYFVFLLILISCGCSRVNHISFDYINIPHNGYLKLINTNLTINFKILLYDKYDIVITNELYKVFYIFNTKLYEVSNESFSLTNIGLYEFYAEAKNHIRSRALKIEIIDKNTLKISVDNPYYKKYIGFMDDGDDDFSGDVSVYKFNSDNTVNAALEVSRLRFRFKDWYYNKLSATIVNSYRSNLYHGTYQLENGNISINLTNLIGDNKSISGKIDLDNYSIIINKDLALTEISTEKLYNEIDQKEMDDFVDQLTGPSGE